MKTKYFFAEVKKINEEDHSIDVVASTIEKDRDGDVILPGAFKKSIRSFKANPVILACHQHRLSSGSSPVIGSAATETVEITDTEFKFRMQFASTPLGDEYWILYRDRHMRAFSVGFIPQKWEDATDDAGRFTHRTYTQVELLEVSAVPVPSNRRALARANAGGFFKDDDDITESVKTILDEFTLRISDQLDEIKSLLIADSGRHAEQLLSEDSDSAGPGGDNTKTEQIVNTIKQITSQFQE